MSREKKISSRYVHAYYAADGTRRLVIKVEKWSWNSMTRFTAKKKMEFMAVILKEEQ